jgi:hypothetical protein
VTAAAVAVLALGCGKHDADHKPRAANADEDACDPATPHVCVGVSVVECEANGHLGRRLRTCHDGCTDGRCNGVCDEASKLIYLVDDSDNFLSFDPRKLPRNPYTLIGKLDCGSYGSPFSMSVDRNGSAWVVYNTGELFKVAITDASCKPTGYRIGASGSTTFGMGFATEAAGGKTEKLYIAADDYTSNLGWIDTKQRPPIAHRIGPIDVSADRHPELTGTSEGKLFAFFPNSDQPAFVQEIDRSTGAGIGTKWNLGSSGLGFVSAWAFAQWGGKFYIFVTGQYPTVRTIDRKTGEYNIVMDSTPYRVTGAGVSTCAPELDTGRARTP